MKKICFLGTLFLFIVSCKTFKGDLANTEELVLNAKKGTVKVATGERSVELTFKSKKKAELEIAGKSIELKFKNDLKIPANGSFKVAAADWNQSYDLIGDSSTVVTMGPLAHEFESCVERVPYTVCDRAGRCRIVYQDHYGSRHVEFRVRTTSQNLEIQLEKDGGEHARLVGQNNRSERMYEYSGPCR